MGSRLEKKSTLIRKRIESHTFDDEGGEEYEASKFGGYNDYFRRKKIKLQNLDATLRAHSDKPQIFKGIVCHVNGYTQPSLNDIHVLVVEHGGGFIQYLDGKTMVTHIIASNLTPKKKEEFKRYRIVKPAWIVDSVKAGKLLPWDNYRVIEESSAQRVLGFDNGQVVSQANQKRQSYREQTDTSWYTSQLKAAAQAEDLDMNNDVKPDSDTDHFTQTITPKQEISERDEYPLPSFTSSVEDALREADEAHAERRQFDRDCEQEPESSVEQLARLQTPPPTSPPQPPDDDESEEADDNDEQIDALKTSNDSETVTEEKYLLRPREGSQEPDYSMAVVRDSEVLRSISPTRLATMTAEEHNALLLSDPKIRKSTVVHPDFLEQYYRESRLHHLSTWKADLKSQLQALAAEKSSSQKLKHKRLPGQRRYIMHVDFDSFFAAVSLKKYPQYKDKPAVVAHGSGSGSEIASCNYPARAFGISNGMWMKRAQDLCPDIKILPYDFPAYEDASRKFYDVIMDTGGVVQSVSIDEALVDISAACFAASGQDGVKRNEGAVHREQTRADEIAQTLRDEVMKLTGCAVSVGIGGNILQAKVALRKAKPAGQYQLKPEDVLDYMGQLEVQKLPGVAWSIGGKLEELGIKLVKDIREVTKERLVNTLGPKTGEKIWEYARGIDRTEVGDQVIRKSVSAEVNWGVRFENQEQVDEFMHGLCGELNKRLIKERVKGKQLTMKVMKRAADAPRDPPKHLGHGKCDTYNKSLQLGVATNDAVLIAKEAIAMMRSFNITPGELRGIGVQMQKLEPLKQTTAGVDQGSQRRLQFKVGATAKTSVEEIPTRQVEDPVQETVTPGKDASKLLRRGDSVLRPIAPDTPSKKVFNTAATQFILPTQVDPSVLAELPEEIRSKLMKHESKASTFDAKPALPMLRLARIEESETSSREASPALEYDPDVLDALPEDVRNEILNQSNPKRKRGEQSLLPQSPRKNRTLPPTKSLRGKGRPRGSTNLFTSRNRLSTASASTTPTLTQSNFIARLPTPITDEITTTDPETDTEPAPLDPDFLAALPSDLRQELLDQQRTTRLQRTGRIDLSLHGRPKALRKHHRGGGNAGDDAPGVGGPLDRVFLLPDRSPRPTFTAKKLSSLPDLRRAVRQWVGAFTDEAPFEEDGEALGRYLAEVVRVERDVAKAVAVVEWLEWVVGEVVEGGVMVGEVKRVWRRVVEGVKGLVEGVVRERGLGRLWG